MICNTYVQFFTPLSDPARLEIIKTLRESPKNVTQISKKLNFEQSRVSHNLRKLKELGFINVKPSGKERIYGLDKKTILPLLKLIDEHVDTYYKHYCKCHGQEKIKRWEAK
ncbi:transcriptional regulator [Candidatus Woesearchaeota archaeon]|jgi:DNA-binding transcriptional ArsR family regulator|nr:transcriptional regulator [Candidatus Woesearchaeota archaeon]|tara:strand:+ start:5459 stop:5791 length:333 start_codon:yes stop_codon:yes gene_type:complete